MRSSVAMLAAAVLLGGCAGSSSLSGASSPEPSDRCGLDFLDQSAEVVSEPEVAEAPEAVSNLALDVSSASNEPVRVTVRFDEKLALDVRTPAVPEVCAHQPVYSHEFRLSGDEVKVVVTTDRNQHRSITVPLGGRKQWVVVQPQDGIPLGLRSYGQEVSWG